MLTSTFIHSQGIGYATERRIWDMGAVTWEHFLDMYPSLPLSPAKKGLLLPRIEESDAMLAADDYAYFARVLPAKDHWRALSHFGDEIAYLDIETTGCGGDDRITVIGLYDGLDMHAFIQGENLQEFPEIVSRYKVLVTFFGSGFDLPFIRRTFPELEIDQIHVDLCFLFRRIGLTGGLKHIEDELGIRRRPEVEGFGGLDAVRLWYEHLNGSEEALELLLTYNKEDVMNMETLLAHGCAELLRGLDYPGPEQRLFSTGGPITGISR